MIHRRYFQLLIIFCTFTTSTIHTNLEFYSAAQAAHFNLPKIPHTFSFYDLTEIKLKKNSYETLIQRWQQKLLQGFEKLFRNLQTELNMSLSEMYSFTHNEQILARYHILKSSELLLPNPEAVISQDDMDPEIASFLQAMIFRYTNKRNIKIFLTDQIPSLTATYGSDVHEHYVFCHSYMYNKQHIQQYYDSVQNQQGYYHIDPCGQNDLRWIEIPSLLQLGIIEAASNIEHQTNLFGFILNNYTFQGRKASDESIQLFVKLQEFHTLLEGILQSKNPLEAAVFLMKMEHRSKDYETLWHAFVKELASCYDENSLNHMKLFAQNMKLTTKNN